MTDIEIYYDKGDDLRIHNMLCIQAFTLTKMNIRYIIFIY